MTMSPVLLNTLEKDSISNSDDCMSQLQTVLLNSSFNFSPFFDATGKLDSSLLTGNRAWLGDFNGCQSLNNSLYCLADLAVNVHPPLQDNFSSVLHWGVCAISQCNESVLESHAPELVQGVLGLQWIEVLNATMRCAKTFPYARGFYATLCVLLCLFLLCVSGTVLDVWYRFTARMRWKLIYRVSQSGPHFVSPPQEETWSSGAPVDAASTTSLSSDDATPQCRTDGGGDIGNINGPPDRQLLKRAYRFRPDLKVKLGQCFSLCMNLPVLSERYPDDIACLHALRFLSVAFVILGQTYFAAYSFGLVSNPDEFVVFGQRVSWQPIGCYFYAVDTFLLMSGLLLSYTGLKKLRENDGKFLVFPYFFHRYIRLLPSIGVLLLIWIYLRPYFAAGPLWYKVQDEIGHCKFWWTNLLFIQNFYPVSSSEACIGWLWYLAVDWQLFVVSAFILYAMFRFRGRTLLLMFISLIISSMVVTVTLVCVYKVKVNPAALLLFSDENNHEMFWRYVNVVLTKPYCRAVPYLVGLWLGKKLDEERGTLVHLKSHNILLGWVLCAILSIATVYAPYPLVLGYDYNVTAHALCASLGPLAWSLATAWFIYACRHLSAGPLNFIFSWNGWIDLSRLTFGMFLFHGIFLNFYFYSIHQSFYLSDLNMVSVYLMTMAFSLFVSLILSLLVETPVAQLSKMLQSC